MFFRFINRTEINCVEMCTARKSIMNGSMFKNISLSTYYLKDDPENHFVAGDVFSPCENCQQTFIEILEDSIMNRQEFLEFAIGNHPLNKTEQRVEINPYDRSKLETNIRKEFPNKFNAEKILDFFENVGRIYFYRTESASGDVLAIDIRWLVFIYWWDDICAVVNCIGYIENCAGRIDELYMSEYGRFYNKDHILLAKNEEDFFDFLTTVEYDFHPVINERVYDVLRKAGWYEGRHIDITDFNNEMKKRSITLSKAQLDFLSEFSGIGFSCKSEYCNFYSLNEILNDCDFVLDEYGDYCLMVIKDVGSPYYIDSHGIIDGIGDLPLGRTTMECINHLVKNTFCWSEPDDPRNNFIGPFQV